VELDEKKICIFLKDASDEERSQKLFDQWWRNTASDIFQSEAEQLYQKIFKKYGLNQPKILVRKMKTLWGSCTPSKDKITLNEYLLKADIRCIQYVILHELTHLIYPNHSKEFYDFLTIHMPDWKERKKQLDNEVVQGL
jgi:predicted metal-dependent hydrolase